MVGELRFPVGEVSEGLKEEVQGMSGRPTTTKKINSFRIQSTALSKHRWSGTLSVSNSSFGKSSYTVKSCTFFN